MLNGIDERLATGVGSIMKPQVHRRKSVHGESGMTIVELVVAMTISSILLVMIFQFLSTQTNSYIEAKQTAEMQQELRWAVNFISDHLKQAGNGVPPTCGWPVLENSDGISGTPDSVSVLGSYKSLVVNTTQPMGNSGAPIKVTDASEIGVGDLVVISDGTFQEIFMVTAITAGEVLLHSETEPYNPSKFLDHTYTSNSTLTVVTYYSFFVDVDEEGRSNLMVRTQAYDPQVLIGDIDDFQLRFKMKDGSWEDEADEIYDIRMIEITIRAKSPNPLKNYIDPVYGDAYKRLEMKSIIIPKNIAIFQT